MRDLKIVKLGTALLLGIAAAAAWGQAVKPPVAMALEDCVVRAMRKNLGVTVQVFTARQAGLGVVQAGEKFLPTLSFEFGRRRDASPSYSWISAADEISTTAYTNYTAALAQALPLGGTLNMALDGYKNDSNMRFQTINPRYGSTLSFNLTQPLLRDFGWRTSRKDILVARNSKEIADWDLKKLLLDTVYAVEQAYWELVFQIESLKVKRQSLKLAEDLLDKTRKEIEIGTQAPKEILSAQAEVAGRKADIIQAEQWVKDRSDALRKLLNLPDEEAGDIVPSDMPTQVKSEIGLEEALAAARTNRPDLRSSEVGVRTKELEFSYAKNQTLPSLSLKAGYSSPGIGGDRIQFLDDNPFLGIIIGTIPGGSGDALRQAFRFLYNNWSVSLSLDLPLSGLLTRAAQAQARIGLDQQIARRKDVEQSAYLEIKAAVRAVRTDAELIEARRAARELAESNLAAEEAKLKAGLSTNFNVIQIQRDVASARSAELRAIIDYTLALGDLERAMGTALDKRRITVENTLEDRS